MAINAGGRLIESLRFANDQAMIANNQEGLLRVTDRLKLIFIEYEMKIINRTIALIRDLGFESSTALKPGSRYTKIVICDYLHGYVAVYLRIVTE